MCSASDVTHFQNLNGSLGSLAEVVSISQAGSTPYTMMAGLGANGTAGVKSSSGTTTDWPEILGGEGGPMAIDPVNSNNWYVNNGAGVSIYLCSQTAPCTPAAFGASPVVTDADVGGDGLNMTSPAPFLVDPLDNSKLLIGTCRVWRGPAGGEGWSSVDAISPIFDNHASSGPCSGNALIRSMAAMALPWGEVVYVGMYGLANGDSTLPGHVLSAAYNSTAGAWTAWTDLTALNPVTNDTGMMNRYGFDISSIFIDPHDSTGETVYVTVAGIPTLTENVQAVYRSTDGGAHFTTLIANLPSAPANSLVVDPQSASTVYVATDAGVYVTRQISSCTTVTSGCWAPLGSGLPEAPVIALSAAPATASVQDLVAATYGRGIWMTPLMGAGGTGSGPATDTLSATSLSFPSTVAGQLSAAQSVTLSNSGSVPLTSIVVSVSGAFLQTNNCTANLAADSSCAISVQFDPAEAGMQTGTLTIADITRAQPQTVALSGTGLAPPALGVSPASLSFSGTVGQPTSPQSVTVSNTGGAPLANVGFQIMGLSAISFSYGSTNCGDTLANGSSCTVQVTFTPTTAGGATASLAVSSSNAVPNSVSVPLFGSAQNPNGLNVSPAQLVFPVVAPGQSSPAQTVTLSNNSGTAVNSLSFPITPPFGPVATANPCGTSLGAGASCTIGVVFSPALDGNFTGTLTIASSSQTQAIVPLSGTGGTPGSVQALPSSIAFPLTGVNLYSSPVTVTLTNPDSVNSLGSFSVSVTEGFRLVSTTCASTLAAGAGCMAIVEFAPTGPGPQSGSLTVKSSALPAGAFVPLSGIGFDFTLAPSSSSSQTIANGQTADYKLLITPLGGLGVFTFQCSTLPPHAACTFSPVTEGIPANSAGTIELQIATGLTTASNHSSPPHGWPALPLACGLVLIPFALARQRKALLLVALLMILAGSFSSCTTSGIIPGGTNPGSGSGTGNTTPGTYPVVVSATSNGVQHQATLTLIVD
ncbi:MAG: choice-of-anchor D domain-containing protein [Terracidiphilus sp.]